MSDSEPDFHDVETSFTSNLNLDGEPEMPDNDQAAIAARRAAEMAKPFDKRNLPDDEEAWKKEIKIQFDIQDVKYWFNEVEGAMKKYGIGLQWSKKDAIVPLLPAEVKEECKPILRLTEEEAGPQIYYDLKQEILSLYGPKQEDAFKKASALRLTGKPSALGKKLLHIWCPGTKPLEGCHCAPVVWGFWDAQMTPAIRSGLAGMSFTKDTYKEIFKKADDLWAANGGGQSHPPVIAAAKASQASSSSNTPNTSSTESPQVSAVRGGGRGGFRGGRGGRGANRGNRGNSNSYNNNQNRQSNNSSSNQNQESGGQKPHQRGPRASPDVPDNACARHWKEGRSATYCSDPLVCSRVHIIAPRQKNSSN